MFETLFRRCNQNQIVLKKQMADPAASNNDTFGAVATVYPIHMQNMKRSGDRADP